jgi:GntR family transcriptional regulator
VIRVVQLLKVMLSPGDRRRPGLWTPRVALARSLDADKAGLRLLQGSKHKNREDVAPFVSLCDTLCAMLTVQLDSPVPLVDQIASGIRRAIASAEFEVDDALPTVRQLARDLGINLNTVARAYRSLEAAGLVITRRGRGTVVAALRSRHQGSGEEVRGALEQRLREVLVDARLAGLSVTEARVMAKAGIDKLWTREKQA